MTLTFGSLFAGIGGFDLGLERAGMECLWQVEIDDYCQQILEKHWPDVAKYRDVYGVSGSTLETVDVICGGFPCQPVSLAGRRQGTDDERWLWPEYARLVGEIRPRYVIVENVPGLRTKGGYEVVADLAEMGYDFEWGALSAEAVGAPHKRERFILVAYSGSKRRQQNTRSPHANESEYAWGSEEDDYQPERDGKSYRAGEISGIVAYSDSEGLEGRREERELGEFSRQKPFGWRGSFEGSSDHWLTEPDVGRVVTRISAGMDGDINAHAGCIKEASTKGIPQTLRLRTLREHLESSAASSESPRCHLCGHPLSSLPCRGTCAPWRLGPRKQETQNLRCLQEGVLELLTRSGQNVQPFLSLGTGAKQCTQAVGSRVDRIRSLGNAIVPQVAEVAGRWVVEHDKEMTDVAT